MVLSCVVFASVLAGFWSSDSAKFQNHNFEIESASTQSSQPASPPSTAVQLAEAPVIEKPGKSRKKLPEWTSCIARSPASNLLLGWKPQCGYKEVDYNVAAHRNVDGISASEVLDNFVFEFHGDSTLREVAKLLIQYGKLKGTLEKKDANSGLRVPRVFLRPPLHTILFRFDHMASYLTEPFFNSTSMNLTREELSQVETSLRKRRRILVLSYGLHEAKQQQMERNSVSNRWESDFQIRTTDFIVERLLGLKSERTLEGAFIGFKPSVAPRVELVVFLSQSAECEAMQSAKLEGFRKMAPHCERINEAVKAAHFELGDIFSGKIPRNSSLAHLSTESLKMVLENTYVLSPLLCHEALNPFNFDVRKPHCTRDGIHLRTKFIRAKLDALFNVAATKI